MQKWMGIGRIVNEPKKVMYNNQKCTFIWVSCPRAWDSKNSDLVPVLFIGKRQQMLEEKGIKKYNGTLVYVIGELSSRIKLKEVGNIVFGVSVFATSLTFWDIKSVEMRRNKEMNHEFLFDTSGLEELEVANDEKNESN